MRMSNKRAKIYIGILSVIVIGMVGIMYSGWGIRGWFDLNYPDFDKKRLPLLNAIINGSAFLVLVSAFWAIKSRKIELHRRLIYVAGTLSTLFLMNYIFYHIISDTTRFGGTGWLKWVYIGILLTHIFLATVSFPFILYTAFLGYTMQADLHRRMTKWVFPVWLYVSMSGVIVYIMISPYYR